MTLVQQGVNNTELRS